MSAVRIADAARILLGGPDWKEARGDVWIRDGRIEAVGGDLSGSAGDARTVNARGLTVMPGLVQTHVHLCQTLFRGLAEERSLLPWLAERIWPLEAAHDPESLRASAELSVLELLLGGTTTILDMGTTHHHDAVFEVLSETGIRAASGKAMMDEGDDVPLGLRETTLDSLKESFDLAERWDGAAGGRLRYAFAPRFSLSCSDVLLREVVSLAKERFLLHTHAAESREEERRVREVKGASSVEHLDALDFLGPGTLVAHCIWLEDREKDRIAETGTHVLHCPSTNLKLGSGVLDVPALLARGVSVSLGCDGAPANNRLDGFCEMRQAALLGALSGGPDALPARDILTLATLGGAQALGWGERIGRLDPGREADVIAVDLETAHAAPCEDAPVALVFAAAARDVRHVIVAGDVVVENGEPTSMDADAVIARSRIQAGRVRERAGLA